MTCDLSPKDPSLSKVAPRVRSFSGKWFPTIWKLVAALSNRTFAQSSPLVVSVSTPGCEDLGVVESIIRENCPSTPCFHCRRVTAISSRRAILAIPVEDEARHLSREDVLEARHSGGARLLVCCLNGSNHVTSGFLSCFSRAVITPIV
jgi:hypothetical protein